MTLRRYVPLKPSRGTVIPPDVRRAVHERDLGCVGAKLGWPCHVDKRGIELDHVRASGGLGMKSPSTIQNLVRLCGTHHRVKTEAGREWRPKLIEYIDGRAA